MIHGYKKEFGKTFSPRCGVYVRYGEQWSNICAYLGITLQELFSPEIRAPQLVNELYNQQNRIELFLQLFLPEKWKKGRNQEEFLSISALKRSLRWFGSTKLIKWITENARQKDSERIIDIKNVPPAKACRAPLRVGLRLYRRRQLFLLCILCLCFSGCLRFFGRMKAPKERRFNIGDEYFTRLVPENCKGVMPRCIYIIYAALYLHHLLLVLRGKVW